MNRKILIFALILSLTLIGLTVYLLLTKPPAFSPIKGKMIIDTGPLVGGRMVHQSLDLMAFLVTLVMVIRIGPGAIALPILIFGFSFLFSALLPIAFGTKILWALPLINSFFGLLGIITFMYVFGLFGLLFKKKE